MKRSITFLLILIFFLSSVPRADAEDFGFKTDADLPPAPVDSSTFFTVMSYNIRYGTADDGPNRWELRREALAHQIAKVDPDLIGFQEALRFQLDYLHEMLPGYGEAGVGRDDGDTLGEYSAVFFREDRFKPLGVGNRWFSDTPDVPGSMSWGNRIPRMYTMVWLADQQTGRQIKHVNLHLDHESQESREKSIDMLTRQFLGPEPPSVITGDFNAGTENRAMRDLFDRAYNITCSLPLVDTWKQVNYRKPPGTFNGFTGDSSGSKIDFVLITGGIVEEFNVLDAKVLTNRVEGRWPSDHFPVIARLQLKE